MRHGPPSHGPQVHRQLMAHKCIANSLLCTPEGSPHPPETGSLITNPSKASCCHCHSPCRHSSHSLLLNDDPLPLPCHCHCHCHPLLGAVHTTIITGNYHCHHHGDLSLAPPPH